MPSSSSTALPANRGETVVSEYVHALVDSTPISESPVIAIAEGPTDTVTAPSRWAQRGSWNAHLAQLLHSMYLVSLIEKAQLGAIHYGSVGISSATANELSRNVDSPPPTSQGASVSHATPMHSVAIDDRWLAAVTRYCHFTCTMDDVARVAMVFSKLVHVRWSLQAWRDTVHPLVDSKQEGHNGATGQRSFAISHQTLSTAPGKAVSFGGRLYGRLYLSASHIISAEEAEIHLQQVLQRKGTLTAQRAWRELVNHHTAYAAYTESMESVMTLSSGVKGTGIAAPGSKSCEDAPGTLDHSSDTDTGEKSTACEASDELLLRQLSAELRASLSAPMLRALLSQMRRDAAHTEQCDQQRTAEWQLNERVMSAYEQVRALLGGKQANGRSAWSLLVAMREESRFEDGLNAAALLSRLLNIPASGLTATMLREAEVYVEPPSSIRKGKETTAKGKTGHRKRKRKAEEADPVRLIHVTQSALVTVTDLESLNEEQLQLVRVQLDRTKGSMKGVMEAISQRCT